MNTLRLFTPAVFRTFPVNAFDQLLTNSLNETNSSYPHINIMENDDKFQIETGPYPVYSKGTNQYELS